MSHENASSKKCHRRGPMRGNGAIYGMGFIGALFYFIHQATSFLMGVMGVIKAVFWPAVLVYKVLEFLKM
jgi:hypothetical protein